MKFAVLFCVLLWVCFSEQIAQFENCPESMKSLPEFQDTCHKVICAGEDHAGVTCSEFRCQPGKQIGYKPMDTSLVYPECCPRPICAD